MAEISEQAQRRQEWDVIEGRISCNKHDVGYVPFIEFGGTSAGWLITVDGYQVEHVMTADTRRGFVEHQVMGMDGKPLIDRIAWRVVTVIKRGRVQILRERKTDIMVVGRA